MLENFRSDLSSGKYAQEEVRIFRSGGVPLKYDYNKSQDSPVSVFSVQEKRRELCLEHTCNIIRSVSPSEKKKVVENLPKGLEMYTMVGFSIRNNHDFFSICFRLWGSQEIPPKFYNDNIKIRTSNGKLDILFPPFRMVSVKISPLFWRFRDL